MACPTHQSNFRLVSNYMQLLHELCIEKCWRHRFIITPAGLTRIGILWHLAGTGGSRRSSWCCRSLFRLGRLIKLKCLGSLSHWYEQIYFKSRAIRRIRSVVSFFDFRSWAEGRLGIELIRMQSREAKLLEVFDFVLGFGFVHLFCAVLFSPVDVLVCWLRAARPCCWRNVPDAQNKWNDVCYRFTGRDRLKHVLNDILACFRSGSPKIFWRNSGQTEPGSPTGLSPRNF